MKMYERSGNTVKEKGWAGVNNSGSLYGKNPKFTFYNNGVFTWDNSTFSGISNIIDKKSYHYFSYNNSVIKKLGLSNNNGVTIYRKKGNNVIRLYGFQDGVEKTMSAAQHNNEKKIWTSGGKVNVTLKDFTSKNLGI